jgi:hypothetical protein
MMDQPKVLERLLPLLIPLAAETMTQMKSPGLLKFRIVLSAICGVFFILQSLNPNFLRPAIESRTIYVHVFLALFGAAFLLQAYFLTKQLKARQSH